MDKETILDAVIAIGHALQQQKWERDRAAVFAHQGRCNVGYPLGVKLFQFDYEAGMDEYMVVAKDMIKPQYDEARMCTEADRLSDTPEGAIKAAVEHWANECSLDESDIEHFESDIDYHRKYVKYAEMALVMIRERLEK